MRGSRRPTVLCLSGLDATGGAGLQADIEAVSSMGAHALPMLTANTVQNSIDVASVTPVPTADLLAQGRALIEDIRPDAIKVGLLANAEVANAVATIIDTCPDVPVVVDPVCSSGTGTRLADDEFLDALAGLLAPRATVLTPNTHEVRLLAPEADSPGACAHQLMSSGCAGVLLTGSHEDTPDVRHRLFAGMRLLKTWRYARLPGEYHGSGCTLSAALAALLAHGLDTVAACKQALDYTHACLRASFVLGRGQRFPDRFHWCQRRP